MNTCKCNKRCFRYIDIPNSMVVYKCKGIRHPKSEKKLIALKEFPTIFCDYVNCEPFESVIWSIDTSKKMGLETKPKEDPKIDILRKVDFLLDKKLFATLQEIELSLRRYGIKSHNPYSESITQFCTRVKYELSGL